jgi:hypothetical protein
MDGCGAWRCVTNKTALSWLNLTVTQVKHAEMPVYQADADIPIGLQLWVNLPSEYKMTTPSYKDIKSEA